VVSEKQSVDYSVCDSLSLSPSLFSGWHFAIRPLPGDDRRFISFLSLLAERFVFPSSPWTPNGSSGQVERLFIDLEINPAATANVTVSGTTEDSELNRSQNCVFGEWVFSCFCWFGARLYRLMCRP
jgi:hypothetical protein